jgi:hypothetical protein
MKNSFVIGIILFALMLGLFIGCHRCASSTGDVTIKTDTLWLPVKDSSGTYAPMISVIEPGHIPEIQVVTKYTVVPGRIDSFIEYERIPIDTAGILKDYYARVFYNDTLQTKFGPMRINDIISKNRIQSRQVLTDFVIPTVTKTITVPVKKRNEIYAGMFLLGDQVHPLTHVGVGATLKTKSDRLFEVGAMVGKNNLLSYQAGFKVKISFRKK